MSWADPPVRTWPRAALNGATTAEQVDGVFKPFTISQGVDAIAKVLKAWAEQRGGTFCVLENERHLWEKIYEVELAGGETAPGVFLYWEDENLRGTVATRDREHRVDRTFCVVLMRGHGFTNLQPQGDDAAPADNTSFFPDDVEYCRDLVRGIGGISEEWPLQYAGASSLPGVAVPGRANVFLDCKKLRFSTANDIPEVDESLADVPDGAST